MSALSGVHVGGGGGYLFVRRRSRGRVHDQASRADRNRVARVQRAIGHGMAVCILPRAPRPCDPRKWQRAFWGIDRGVSTEKPGSWRTDERVQCEPCAGCGLATFLSGRSLCWACSIEERDARRAETTP